MAVTPNSDKRPTAIAAPVQGDSACHRSGSAIVAVVFAAIGAAAAANVAKNP
jgi:hypothetical protein